MGRLPTADPAGSTLRRQGSDLPDRAGQRRRPPPPRPLPPPLEGHLACPPHGRRRPQAALPLAPARELSAATQQLLVYFWLSVSEVLLLVVAALARGEEPQGGGPPPGRPHARQHGLDRPSVDGRGVVEDQDLDRASGGRPRRVLLQLAGQRLQHEQRAPRLGQARVLPLDDDGERGPPGPRPRRRPRPLEP